MKNPMVIIVAAVLALIILLGGTLILINVVTEAQAVVSYDGVYVSRGVASYLAATYKYDHVTIELKKELAIKGITFRDTPEFWAKSSDAGISYGDGLKKATEDYIRGVVVGSYLFDSISALTGAEREYITSSVRQVLDFKAGGNESTFNAVTEKMGFTYSDFAAATEMMYKASMLKSVLWGVDGELLKSGSDLVGTERYLQTYTRARLLFIRLNDDYVLGTDGKPTYEGNEYVMKELTQEEYDRRIEDIDYIKALIRGYEEDANLQMSEEAFYTYQKRYNSYDDYKQSGYYFAPSTGTRLEEAGLGDSASALLIDTLAEMENYEYRMLSLNGGSIACFVYKCPVEPYAYSKRELADFFEDFYSNCASFLNAELLAERAPAVNVKDSYYDIDLIALPYNNVYVAG